MTFLCPCVFGPYDCDRRGSRRRDRVRRGMDRSTDQVWCGRDHAGDSSSHRSEPSHQTQRWRTQTRWQAAVVSRPDNCCQHPDRRESGHPFLATQPRWWQDQADVAELALRCLCSEFQPAASNHDREWRWEGVMSHRQTTPTSLTMPPRNRHIIMQPICRFIVGPKQSPHKHLFLSHEKHNQKDMTWIKTRFKRLPNFSSDKRSFHRIAANEWSLCCVWLSKIRHK